MKKFIALSMAAVFAAGVAGAQNEMVIVEQPADDVEVTAEAAFVSAYVWRGQVINNDFAVQPQLSLATHGFSFNVWGNYDLIENKDGSRGDFSEIDLSVAYTLPKAINDLTFVVGLINYSFPTESTPTAANPATPSTTELFISATVTTLQDYVIPSVTFFGDIDEVDGTYILFDIVAPYQVSEYLAVEGGVSAGWGNTRYNDHYWGSRTDPTPDKALDEGFNDYNFYGVASYEVAENLTASLNLTYTMLEGGQVRDSAEASYEAKEKFWFGVNMAYDF